MKKSCSARRAPAPKRVRVSDILHRNTAIIPASQLRAAREWQEKANRLPDGSTLIVLPAGNGRLKVIARKIMLTIDGRGQRVSVVTVH
jgi:hypothetical protein